MKNVYVYSKAKEGAAKLSNYFVVSEMSCKDGSDTVLIDSELVELLHNIRSHFGKPVVINSGYRNDAYNAKVGGATYSYHKYGMAADIVVSGAAPLEVAKYAVSIGARGVGLYTGFTHVDTRPTKYYWDQRSGSAKAVSSFG